jgi:uncharacterized LabA/DUF88 family protein
MSRRFAILLDGGFVWKRLRLRFGRPPVLREILEIADRASAHPDFGEYERLRIYYYDAPPATGALENPLDGSVLNLRRTEVHARQAALLDALELAPNVALRMGEIVVRGWRLRPGALAEISKAPRYLGSQDLAPEITQKGVDLRIGLDIARLSLLRMVAAIVVVTGDSDMTPAFKFARREGVRVYLDHLGGPVKRELKAHVDVVL